MGDEPVKNFSQRNIATGTLKLLTATDCIKDRLSAYYHWQDRQSLQQALSVARKHAFDIENIKGWSKREGMEEKFAEFQAALSAG